MKTKTRIMLPLLFSIFSANTVMAQEGEGAPTTPSRPISSGLPVTPFTPNTMDLLAETFGSPVAQAHDTRSAGSVAAFLAHGDVDEADWLTDTGPIHAGVSTHVTASASTVHRGADSDASSASASSSEQQDPFATLFDAPESEAHTAVLPPLDGEVMSPSRPALAASGTINNRIRFGDIFNVINETSPKKRPKGHGYDLRKEPTKKVKE